MRPETVTSSSPKPHLLGLSHRNIIFSNRLNRIKSRHISRIHHHQSPLYHRNASGLSFEELYRIGGEE
ncbi:hypothetical protein HanXRQr2_Chr11g0487121 [Helianthus annuus]|uniref:Uncharacterized protein n=1 Tax=Helianthus annuus TaxID=4232 RepID=A0A9K3HNP7_HELAN|nr:hypothetical protein HanXRQr2_Chr11g0487121 [Helianthus annuus]KAJ0874858.1 hypothetical protein HanPSC8_Chr11g0469311 [Helianthus annuus]